MRLPLLSIFICTLWCTLPFTLMGTVSHAAANDDNAVYNFGTRSAKLPQPVKKAAPAPEEKVKPAEKPAPAPKPQEKPKPIKNEDLKIPQDAAKKKDLSFLEGCWVSETGLFSHPSGVPIVAEYCFDKKGKGRRFVRERNGQVCSGSAKAQFQGTRLEFDAPTAKCPQGGQYVPQDVKCTGSETSTQCHGNELGGKRLKWDARFKRK